MSPDPGVYPSTSRRTTSCAVTPPPDVQGGMTTLARISPPPEYEERASSHSTTCTTSVNSGSILATPPAVPMRARHRQRLAHHYLHQIRVARQLAQQSAQHHTHHHYHRYHNGRGSESTTRSERSPFLMVKILLFSLMTIDFVMNTIGLAVLVVMAKNHHNNVMAERALTSNTADASLNSPRGTSTSEWTLLLPLLPSFIFAEFLTLLGMLGVCCDLFSFTMTYAILKLITSLCYPSLASTAAVAAMATATSHNSLSTFTTLNHSNIIATDTEAANLIPAILPMPVPLDASSSNFSSNNYNNNSNNNQQQQQPIPVILSRPYNFTFLFNDDTTTSTTTTPSVNSNQTFGLLLSSTTRPPDDLLLPLPTTTTTTATVGVNLTQSSTLTTTATETPSSDSATTTTYQPMMIHKHNKLATWVKNYGEWSPTPAKEYHQRKKSDRMAKLKAREKQLRSKLLRLEAQYNNRSSTTATVMSQKWHPDSVSQDSNRFPALLVPLDSTSGPHHSNIKYHHRVWDALLVTFEVIFAVAFAFNTLSKRRDYDEEECERDYLEGNDFYQTSPGGGRVRRRRRRAGGSTTPPWPYSPLATSLDAFYFAAFQLPPPPPPYFRNAQLRPVTSGNLSSIIPDPDQPPPTPTRNASRFTLRAWLPQRTNSHNNRRSRPEALTSDPRDPPLYENISRDEQVSFPDISIAEVQPQPPQPPPVESISEGVGVQPEIIRLQVIVSGGDSVQPEPQVNDATIVTNRQPSPLPTIKEEEEEELKKDEEEVKEVKKERKDSTKNAHLKDNNNNVGHVTILDTRV